MNMGIDPVTHQPLGESTEKKLQEGDDEIEQDTVYASLSGSQFEQSSPPLTWRPESPLWSFNEWGFEDEAVYEEISSDLFTNLDNCSLSPLQ